LRQVARKKTSAKIVGVADVVDCVRTHASKWKFPDQWGCVLENPRRLPFRECKTTVEFFYPKFMNAASGQTQ